MKIIESPHQQHRNVPGCEFKPSGAPAGAPAAREIRGIRRLAGWFAWGREDRMSRMAGLLRAHMS